MTTTLEQLPPFVVALIGCAGLLLLKFVYNAFCSSGPSPSSGKARTNKKGANNAKKKNNKPKKKKKAVSEVSAFIAENSGTGSLRKRTKKENSSDTKKTKPEAASTEKKPSNGSKSKKPKKASKPPLTKAEKEKMALEKAQRKLKEGKVTLKQKDIDDGWEVAVTSKGRRGNRTKSKPNNVLIL